MGPIICVLIMFLFFLPLSHTIFESMCTPFITPNAPFTLDENAVAVEAIKQK